MTLTRKHIPLFLFLLPVLAASCGVDDNASAKLPQNTGQKFSPDGMAVFRKYCVACHGADGKLGLNGAKDLTQSVLPIEERINVITNGRKLMTPFNTLLTPEEIKVVAEYTLTLKK